jgi:hypothetical protein
MARSKLGPCFDSWTESLAGQWHLIPGNPWQPDIERPWSTRKLAPFFVGSSGFGRFHERDICHSVGLAKKPGTVASLLKHDLGEEEIVISDLRQVAERF